MKEIKLKIMPDGEVKVEVRGVKGAQCVELTKFLEDQLGLVIKREKTAEYYQAVDESIVVTERATEQK